LLAEPANRLRRNSYLSEENVLKELANYKTDPPRCEKGQGADYTCPKGVYSETFYAEEGEAKTTQQYATFERSISEERANSGPRGGNERDE
jgi:hypothetical protein